MNTLVSQVVSFLQVPRSFPNVVLHVTGFYCPILLLLIILIIFCEECNYGALHCVGLNIYTLLVLHHPDDQIAFLKPLSFYVWLKGERKSSIKLEDGHKTETCSGY
jgi:hypothetical protein